MSNIWVQEFEDGWLYVVNAEYTEALLSITTATHLSTFQPWSSALLNYSPGLQRFRKCTIKLDFYLSLFFNFNVYFILGYNWLTLLC